MRALPPSPPPALPHPQFPDIAPATWEHPADAAALAAVRAVPGVDRVVAATFGRINEWTTGLRMLHDAREVTDTSHPRLFRVHREVCDALDPPMALPLFAKPMHAINAAAIGVDRPCIIIGATAEDHLPEDALRTILAHEAGHVMSGHIRWKMTLWTLLYVGWAGVAMPVSLPLLVALVAALLEWDRKSELSADRAAALVCGGPEAVCATLDQVRAEHRTVLHDHLPANPAWRDRMEWVLRSAHSLIRRHPPVDDRIAEVRAFAESAAFEQALLGHYPRRSEDRAARHQLAGAFLSETESQLRSQAGARIDTLWSGLSDLVDGLAPKPRSV